MWRLLLRKPGLLCCGSILEAGFCPDYPVLVIVSKDQCICTLLEHMRGMNAGKTKKGAVALRRSSVVAEVVSIGYPPQVRFVSDV